MPTSQVALQEMQRGLPLCRSYVIARFATQPVQVQAGDTNRDLALTWSVGVLGDGQQEVLGVWQHGTRCSPNWDEIFAELQRRGVERIAFVADADLQAARRTFPQVRPTSDTALDDHSVSGRTKATVRRTEIAVRPLQERLSRALAKAAPFKSREALKAFAEACLVDGERRIRARQRRPSHPPAQVTQALVG